MADLRERFESLSRTQSPDLWPEIEAREPRSSTSSRPRRALTALVALFVAAAGIGVAALTFGGSERPRMPGASAGAATNGPILYRVGGEGGSTWYSVMPDGSDRRAVFEGEPMRIAQIAWSPDGTRIAYQNPIADERGIFVANADGSNPFRLTRGANDAWPAWSPDGTRIVFSSTRYDPSIPPCTPGEDFHCPTDLYTVNVDGSTLVRLTDDSANVYQPAWSPSGDEIAFTSSANNITLVAVMKIDGSERRVVSSDSGGSEFSPTWSPDGSQIVFAAIRREDWGIWTVRPDGSDERLLFGGPKAGYVDNPEWSPEGTSIAFVGNTFIDDYSPNDALYVMRADGTGVTPIADAPGVGVAGDIAWQPIPAPVETIEPAPEPPSTAEVVETFEVGEVVSSVVYGEGSVWVAVSNDDGSFGGTIVRIDPQTHEVQAEIQADVIPTWEVGGGAMVFEGGDLWLAGNLEAPGAFDDPGGGADAAVIRVDTSTNEVVQTIPVGGAGGADLTFLDGELWVLVSGDETVDHAMEVVRVDPQTGDVSARFALDANWAHTLVAAEGRLVTVAGGEDAVNVDGRVIEIDPATGATTEVEIPSRFFTPMPVLWRGQVWISTDPGFVRFDPLGEVFPEPPVTLAPRFGDCCGFVEADDRGIWFLSPDLEDAGGRVLNVFDPATGEATALVELDEGSPVAMAVAPDAVWILNYEGTLTHVDLG
jgi:TolB protein